VNLVVKSYVRMFMYNKICDFFGSTAMAPNTLKFNFRGPHTFFFVNFELGFSVTASWIVLKLQFILLLFITKLKKEKYGALEERRIFQIKKGPCLHLLWF
jgi:hypothetical protein